MATPRERAEQLFDAMGGTVEERIGIIEKFIADAEARGEMRAKTVAEKEIERLQKENAELRGYLEKIAGVIINEVPVTLIQTVPLGDRYPVVRLVSGGIADADEAARLAVIHAVATSPRE